MSVPSDKAQLLAVGHVVGVYGIKGWLKVKSFTEPAENLFHYSPWFLASDGRGLDARQVEVDDYQRRPQGFVVHLKGVDDRDAAAAWLAKTVLVSAECLPELEQDDYYWHQLIGLTVFSEHGGARQRLGKVTGFLETGANDVLVVEGDDQALDRRERLVPFVLERYVTRVDVEGGEIWVDWDPEF